MTKGEKLHSQRRRKQGENYFPSPLHIQGQASTHCARQLDLTYLCLSRDVVYNALDGQEIQMRMGLEGGQAHLRQGGRGETCRCRRFRIATAAKAKGAGTTASPPSSYSFTRWCRRRSTTITEGTAAAANPAVRRVSRSGDGCHGVRYSLSQGGRQELAQEGRDGAFAFCRCYCLWCCCLSLHGSGRGWRRRQGRRRRWHVCVCVRCVIVRAWHGCVVRKKRL